ncbi:squalene/phytoene synthase family protein [Limimaricola pyoseonensis]|uniref:Squalene synthase HpnC n=1 Tax=Limimaricola pyoseonensis TaxID=521013 RepID=A0A1G7FWQ1_9RHOB|nr:squalene/phytoene synthase family protein [Limimaricola pyoseonensis]SDE80175.1 squalene synthase HpnC [Limimaricola pyoseonensis]
MEKIVTMRPGPPLPPPLPTAATGPARARGAGHENFPVASRLLPARLRPAVMAFYRVVRAADDIADAPDMAARAKLAGLDAIEAGLRGRAGGDPRGPALRAALAEVGRPGLERHALAMLDAFRADVAARPCADWEALMAYCRSSAVPVGRFLLELHGEGRDGQGASDALCCALQVLNHLQDLGEDRRDLGRVYLPADMIAAAGGRAEGLAARRLDPALRAAVDRALDACDPLLAEAAHLPGRLRSRRLAAEARAIVVLARRLQRRLRRADPLAGRVAPARGDALAAALAAAAELARPRQGAGR